jgi:uncharacterized protein (DUF1697 family)
MLVVLYSEYMVQVLVEARPIPWDVQSNFYRHGVSVMRSSFESDCL